MNAVLSVAILFHSAPPNVGGVESTMGAHVRLLQADGRKVRLVVGKGSPAADTDSCIVLPEISSRGPAIEQLSRELGAGVVSLAFSAMVERISAQLGLALQGFDVLIAHNVLTQHKNLALTAALAHLHREGRLPRMIAWCHDFSWLDPLYTSELHSGYPWDLIRTAWEGVQYVAVSHDRAALLADLLHIPEREIEVITPGIDLQQFLKLEPETYSLVGQANLLAAEPLLLLPARITRRKNIELAIQIVAGMKRLGLKPALVITGPPGPHNPTNTAYLDQLQRLRRQLDVEHEVVFLYELYVDSEGKPLPVSDAMVSDLFRLADCLLFPSSYEGFGIPILEAGLIGMPIFCSDIKPFRETADEAALFFEVDESPGVIADRIMGVLAGDMRTRLRQHVRTQYSWESIYRRRIRPLLERSSLQ